MRMCSLVLFATWCLVPQLSLAEPTAEEWARVMNLSGRQRMLTQKMSKEALFISASVNAPALRTDLVNTMKLFEESLQGLREGSEALGLPATENPRIVQQLDKVQALYLELKPILDQVAQGGTMSLEQATKLAELNLPLLKQMNKAVKMYERGAKKVLTGDDKAAVTINLAGKQRMLTQKMTKECLLVQLGINTEENRLNLRQTTSLFDRTLQGLLDGDDNLDLPGTSDPTIRAQLELVGNIWSEVKPLVTAELKDHSLTSQELEKLSTINVALLREMNKGVQLFEEAAN